MNETDALVVRISFQLVKTEGELVKAMKRIEELELAAKTAKKADTE